MFLLKLITMLSGLWLPDASPIPRTDHGLVHASPMWVCVSNQPVVSDEAPPAHAESPCGVARKAGPPADPAECKSRAPVSVAVNVKSHEPDHADDDQDADDADDDDDADHEAPPAVVQAAPRGPWIGVQLAPTPKALVRQLNLQGQPTMILNVVSDSPADQAGLEQYDVIVEIGGTAVDSIDAFRKELHKRKAGESVELVLIRGGKRKTVTVKPDKWADLSKVTYKYEREPEETVQDLSRMRGGVLQRGPGGDWVFRQMPDVSDLQRYLSVPTPGAPGMNWSFSIPGAEQSAVVRTEKDGKSLEIRRNPDGSFKVLRTEREGSESTTTVNRYANADEFRKKDAKAYKVFREMVRDGETVVTPDVNALGDALQRSLAAKEQAMRQAERALRDAQRRLESHTGERRGRLPAEDERIRFDVAEDGKLTVTIRDDAHELVLRFENEKEMEQRRPNLHKKYLELNAQEKD